MSQPKKHSYLTDSEDFANAYGTVPIRKPNDSSRELSSETRYYRALMAQMQLQKTTKQSNSSSAIESDQTYVSNIPYNDICSEKDASQLLKYFRPIIVDLGQLCLHPHYGVKQFKNGLYFGVLATESREQQGVLLYQDGRIYEGGWNHDQKHGKARDVYPNGNYFLGEYQRGQRNGKGQFQWKSGERYDGEWKNGQKHGSGLWKGVKGDSYVGEWQLGQPHGYGVHRWVNGDRYEGQFQHGLKHGQGIERFNNGDSYNGYYDKGKPNGYGCYTWANGDSYKGNFLSGLRHGQGKWESKEECYQGDYQNDRKCGQGVYRWITGQGQTYIGQFFNDLRHGFGRLELKDGSFMEGEWVNGHLKEGNGGMIQFRATMREGGMQFQTPQDHLPHIAVPHARQRYQTIDPKSPYKVKLPTSLKGTQVVIERKESSPQVARKQTQRERSVDVQGYGLEELQLIHMDQLEKFRKQLKGKKSPPWIPGGIPKNHNPLGFQQLGTLPGYR